MAVRRTPITDTYRFLETLGCGGFSIVKRAAHVETGEYFAIKIIDRKVIGEAAAVALKTEISILQQVRHPNIIALSEIYDNGKKLYLVTELVTGGELFDRIVTRGHFSERDAAMLVRKILEATQYLHSVGIVHRDLKPENLLLSDPSDHAEIKIADFGLAKIIGAEDQVMFTTCGTPGYVAPEVLQNEGYDKQVDVWSIGAIAYILLCGFPPFYEESMPVLLEMIMKAEFEFPDPYWTAISDDAKDFIRKVLTVDARTRYTTQQCLEHHWLQTGRARTENLGMQSSLRSYNEKAKLMRQASSTVIDEEGGGSG